MFLLFRGCSLLALTFVLYAAHASIAHTKSWQVVPADSQIKFSGVYAGQAFKGVFKNWTAKITFDPTKLDAAIANVEIDLASAETGNTTYDKTLPTSDWFNVKKEPNGRFITSTFSQDGDTFRAEGTLSLRGKTVPVVLNFTFSENSKAAKIEGTTKLNRLDFDIGRSSDPSGDWVKPNIEIAISVALKPAQN